MKTKTTVLSFCGAAPLAACAWCGEGVYYRSNGSATGSESHLAHLNPRKRSCSWRSCCPSCPGRAVRHRACEQGACPALGQEAARPPFSLRPGWWHLAVLLAAGSCAVISWKRRISPVRALSASRWFASLGSGEFLLTCTLSPPKNVTLD